MGNAASTASTEQYHLQHMCPVRFNPHWSRTPFYLKKWRRVGDVLKALTFCQDPKGIPSIYQKMLGDVRVCWPVVFCKQINLTVKAKTERVPNFIFCLEKKWRPAQWVETAQCIKTLLPRLMNKAESPRTHMVQSPLTSTCDHPPHIYTHTQRNVRTFVKGNV